MYIGGSNSVLFIHNSNFSLSQHSGPTCCSGSISVYSASSVEISYSNFIDCVGERGGAVNIQDSPVYIHHSKFYNNRAKAYNGLGGGLYLDSDKIVRLVRNSLLIMLLRFLEVGLTFLDLPKVILIPTSLLIILPFFLEEGWN